MKRILLSFLFIVLLAAPAFAGFEEGKKAYDAKDWKTAIKELRPLAEGGDERALVVLGNMYRDGWGVTRDFAEAMRLYKRAAAKNNTTAMVVIGAMYISALGVDNNLGTALAWEERAARLGDMQGAYMAARILIQGNRDPADNVKPDFYAAYKWFRIAERSKTSEKLTRNANYFAERIAKMRLKPEEVAAADKEIAAWTPTDPATLGPLPPPPPPRPAPKPVEAEPKLPKDLPKLPSESIPPRVKKTTPKAPAAAPESPKMTPVPAPAAK